MAVYLSFDGPISSGKTKVGSELAKDIPNSHFIPETGHDAGGEGKESALGIWATDKLELSAAFQAWMFGDCKGRCEVALFAKEFRPDMTIIVDRSLKGNAVFEAVSYALLGEINVKGNKLYQALKRSQPVDSYGGCDFNCYLWVPPSICYSRMCKRNNVVETADYNLDTFWNIEKSHFASLLENLSSEKPHPQIVLDWSKDFEVVYPAFKAILPELSSQKGTSFTRVTLLKDVALFTGLRYDPQFTSVLDVSGRSLFDPTVITEVLNELSYSGSSYKIEQRHVLLLIHPETPSEVFMGSFKLTFLS
jgi:hypothetical protein